MTAQRANPNTEKSEAVPAIVLMAVIILLAAYSLAYGLQTLAWVAARRAAHADPWLREVPTPLPAPVMPPAAPSAASRKSGQAAGNHLQAYGYEFSVPWSGTSESKVLRAGTEFRFDSGQVVVFFDPETQLDTLRALKSAAPAEYRKYQNALGEQSIDTNYDLYRIVYAASPEQLSPLMRSSDAERMNVLLLWKLAFGFDLQPGVYSFQFGKNRGFQFGSPENGRPVAVRVFDDQDNQFRFLFTTRAGSGAQITQEDINSAVQSLRLAPILER